MIDTRHLRHFLAVTETGSFRQAARKVNLSQPALTKSIQRMEHLLGEKLFDRGARTELTPLGQLVREQAEQALAGLDNLEREAELFRGVERGELKIGVGPYMAESIVGPALGRLLARHPKLRITVHVDDFRHFPPLLRQRAIDLFVADVTGVESDADLDIIPVPAEEVVWFTRPSHPLAAREAVALDELFAFPFVAPTLPTWTSAWFEEHLPAALKPVQPAVTCNNYSTLKDIVRHSDCFSGVGFSAIVEDLRDGRFRRLPVTGAVTRSNPGVVLLKGRTASPAAKALVAELRHHLDRLARWAGQTPAGDTLFPHQSATATPV